MAKALEKVFINCAVTGSIHIPTQTPYLPKTSDEIAEAAIDAARAGAATVHLHARDPETGQPKPDVELFEPFVKRIHEESDVVICITTGGGLGMTIEERTRGVQKFKPELGTFNMGSFNFGLFPVLSKFKEFKYDWEQRYLEMTRDFVFTNTFKGLEGICTIFRETGTKPELEIYDLSHLYNTAYLVEAGFLDLPVYFQFIMGILGTMGSSVENLVHIKNTADKLFGNDYVFSVFATGRHEFNMCTVAAIMGGAVRVGMEDNLYLAKGVLAKSNAEMVAKMKHILEELSFEVATPQEVREILGLKGKAHTNI